VRQEADAAAAAGAARHERLDAALRAAQAEAAGTAAALAAAGAELAAARGGRAAASAEAAAAGGRAAQAEAGALAAGAEAGRLRAQLEERGAAVAALQAVVLRQCQERDGLLARLPACGADEAPPLDCAGGMAGGGKDPASEGQGCRAAWTAARPSPGRPRLGRHFKP